MFMAKASFRMPSASRDSFFAVQTSTARKNHRSGHTEGQKDRRPVDTCAADRRNRLGCRRGATGKPVASPSTSLIACAFVTDDPKARPNRNDLGRVFDEVPELYDRVRPGYPDELFADLGAIT